MTIGPVVVGVDGSPASVTAAWWAAREAVDRHLPVLLLHSWTTQPLDVPVPQEALSKQRYGGQVLRRAEAELLHRYADLPLTTELVAEPAGEALLERGRSAAMVVLGSRGHGSVASFLLGSIGLHVLALAQCPVVAVRAGDPAVEAGWGHPATAGRGEVVVGVHEPGPAADALLDFAFTAAQPRGSLLRAVRALALPSPVPPRQEAGERARLTAVLAPWREKFPDVPVALHLAAGPATQVVLAACAHSRLTVVGRRRHPSHHAWKLGPVPHAALHHVPCPVAVVPHD
ncbi:universal stress protein [Streptomyces sp. 7R007]